MSAAQYVNHELIEGDSAFCQPEETLLTSRMSAAQYINNELIEGDNAFCQPDETVYLGITLGCLQLYI